MSRPRGRPESSTRLRREDCASFQVRLLPNLPALPRPNPEAEIPVVGFIGDVLPFSITLRVVRTARACGSFMRASTITCLHGRFTWVPSPDGTGRAALRCDFVGATLTLRTHKVKPARVCRVLESNILRRWQRVRYPSTKRSKDY
jgi:hypothetical protein